MSKRNRRPRRAAKPRHRLRPERGPLHGEEPDLVAQIGAALALGDPLSLLALASTLMAVVDPRGRHPIGPPVAAPDHDELIESLLGVPLPETSALLAAMAGLSADDVLRRRVRREITERAHPLPSWLGELSAGVAGARVVELTHVLGDGDNLLVEAELPGGHRLTAVVYIDHNMGTLVKDAFVVSEPLHDVLAHLRRASADDPDLVVRPLDPADARARITEAVRLAAISFPPFETDTWPASRALVEWMTGLLPTGGNGYQHPDWDDAALDDLARRFRASPFADVDDPADLLSMLLRFGADYAPGDPLRMSPVVVELLLLDRVPRKVVAPVEALAPVPDLLRAFVRFCHHERGIRPALTEQTLAVVDAYEPEYQQLIRTDRPQGPAALLPALGVLDEPERDYPDIMLDTLRRAVGGDAALDTLDADPLPAEPFDWGAVRADVYARVGEVLDLVDRCCADLLDVEYRTACRRLLADIAAGDPAIFRRRSRADTAAAAICWLAGQANSLFDREPITRKLAVKDLVGHFGVSGSVSQRSEPLLRAIGIDPHQQYGRRDLGSPRYLTGPRRARILAHRDRYRAMAGGRP
jgi:hypothetical protein